MILERLGRRWIRVGDLTVIEGGRSVRFGNGDGPQLVVELSPGAAARIATHPELRLGEAYMDGSLRMVRGSVYDFLDLVGRNLPYDRNHQRVPAWRRAWFAALRQLQQLNDRAASRHHVAVHYDLSLDLYRRFLDSDLQYSCAYFERPGMTLEEAQAAKKAHIARKLLIRPGDRVLDIGCGWGGLGLTLAQDWGAQVQGVTLSTEQLATARTRAEAAGLSGRARFDMIDYRDVPGPFDRIVSVGMFEHVGRPNFQAYFDRVAELLTDDGVALIHAIGRKDEPSVTNPWINKYIFPGGYIPALSEVLPAIERAGLWVTDLEVLRLHYAETVRCWRDRFAARRAEIVDLYDERLARMFEFYLAVSEISFRWGGHMVFQVQLTKRVDAAPLTRNYMADPPQAAETPGVRALSTAAE
ncbi:MAG: class I SAM-dependent methyltransferase [Caulobacteraceae bacterium]|nr:class I SAM-dependent methyltransferase [Caulobacter sp.]